MFDRDGFSHWQESHWGVCGAMLESLGWVQWPKINGRSHSVWLYKSARMLWSVDRGFVHNGRVVQITLRDAMVFGELAWQDLKKAGRL